MIIMNGLMIKYMFSAIKYPVLDIHNYELYKYHGQYGILLKDKRIIHDKWKVAPQQLNKFLIDQLRLDQEELFKPKEVLFLGRSNVGKSSVINALAGKNIAKVSKKTGSTLKLHFHQFMNNRYIVDAPGYGFAKINVDAVKLLQGMLQNYVTVSSRLCRIYLLLDSEHGIKKNDEFTLQMLAGQNINIQVVLTKIDKIPEAQLYDRQLYFARLLKSYKNIHPLLHSVSVRENFGISDLEDSLIDSFTIHKTRNTYEKEDQLIKYLQANKRPWRMDVNKEVRLRQIPVANKQLQIK